MATTTLPRAAGYSRSWVYEWLTTTDHKKIGIMYVTTAYIFMLLGGLLALGIRADLWTATSATGASLIPAALYNQLFTMHGTTMIFFFVMPMLAGFANYIVPLQIGAADMAFPRINALSFWIIPFSGILLFSGFLLGGAASAGWTSYAPLAEAKYSPGVGQDLWILGLLLNGMSSILGAINLLVTIFKLRAPGLTMLRLPIFVWTVLVTQVLLVFAVPVLASGLAMLFIDRNYGGSFFDPAAGGDAVLWQHVFWFFGHPEVYILILPAFGVISEVIPVFSGKPLFGYKAFILATAAIGILGFGVWAHHMFATGVVFLAFFSATTFLISVPTGVKMFNWVATMWRGKLNFKTPMLFAVGFLISFLIGGLDGAFSASTPVDFDITDTYWVVVAPALRALRRVGHGDHGRDLLLVPQDERTHAQRAPRPGPLLADVHRPPADLLPDAPAGPGGHAPPDRRVRTHRLAAAQPGRDDRRLHDRGEHAALPVEHLHHAAPPGRSARRPLGCLHARVGDHQPAAALQLRAPA